MQTETPLFRPCPQPIVLTHAGAHSLPEAGRVRPTGSRSFLSDLRPLAGMLGGWLGSMALVLLAFAGAGDAFAQSAGNQSMVGPITGATIPFRVYLPPSYATQPARRFPVIYHLHGAGARYTSGNATLEGVYEGYMVNGQMPEAIIVYPDGMIDSFWADSFDGAKKVETQVIRELLPRIDATYRTIADRKQRVVQGFSMGGFGAMEYAAKFPELFGAAIGLDGALTLWSDLLRVHPEITSGVFNNDQTYFNRYSPNANATANRSQLLALGTKFFVLVGQLVQDNRNWMNTLDSLGIPYQYHDSTCRHSFSCIMGNKTDMDAVAAFLSAYLTAGATSPAPIANFQAVPGDRQIRLTWSNPGDPKLTGVRIQRSTTEYPASPTSGTTVYDGLGVSFLDTGLVNGTIYYYRAYAHDGAPNYSAGVGISATPQAAPVPAPAPSRLVNLSILSALSAGETMAMGAVVGGAGTSGAKPLLARGVGPSLAQFGGSDLLPDPKLSLVASGGGVVATNNDWGSNAAALSAAFTQTGAFALLSSASRDAAIFAPELPAGSYTVLVSDNATGAGAVIAELFDATPSGSFTATTPRLINVSALKHLGSGLTMGFVVGGNGAKSLLIRAIGPTLGAAPFNVAGVVSDPQVTLYSGQTTIGANDNWGGAAALSAAFTQVGAFALPAASRDAALLATVQPGSYTVLVSGVGAQTGVALIEVYEVP